MKSLKLELETNEAFVADDINLLISRYGQILDERERLPSRNVPVELALRLWILARSMLALHCWFLVLNIRCADP